VGEENGAAFKPYETASPIARDDPYGLRPWHTKLINLRRREPALRSTALRFVDLAPKVLGYLRETENSEDAILVLLNYGKPPVQIAVPANLFPAQKTRRTLRDLLSGERISLSRGDTTVMVGGYGVRILKSQ
jgi:hypothetical protein